MNKPEEIFAELDSFEMRRKFKEIEKVENLEQQGYEAAPLLAKMAGIDAETLLFGTVSAGEDSSKPGNVMRTIGVIRWCLDQRGKV